MNEQKQIKEMAKVIGDTWLVDLEAETKGVCEVLDEVDIKAIARELYEQGYRKVPDGTVILPPAVILTPEERDEKLKEISETLAECDELQELNIKYYNEAKDLRRKVAGIEAENERLKEVIADQNELCWNCKKSVKEFGDKIKAKLFSVFGKTICSDLDTQDIADIIDEVLKEV